MLKKEKIETMTIKKIQRNDRTVQWKYYEKRFYFFLDSFIISDTMICTHCHSSRIVVE